ncbi:MAG: Fosmidomycin resistance protein [Sphingobacteriales bacterium SCN 48-20]|uniref:MFS transporter n=1 Tax=Terrimonas ferruginea TaxID=249 RepID=UPI00086A6382|nr:MFS transporter [Terrimonas ferruginea]MBN8783040.1 MFS transporter [Terrimonas ferruginea]ODT96109.1 MAG: Fosmidomycin resistance protein [Sphingobacteriales bacterium SCN 48-20]OJW44218.1 MAG: MFS transporter [Sphingobacteriales bacterium 48-107]
MKTTTTTLVADVAAAKAERTVYPVLMMISVSHFVNDTIQSLIPASYPILRTSLNLSFSALGLITLVFQLAASILQPFVGAYTDRRPKPYFLVMGMAFSFTGLLLLAFAQTYPLVLLAVVLVGMGSAVFHPEASKVAYLASGGRRGFAQSVFQLGGNAGSSAGPLLAALIIAPFHQERIAWFAVLAIIGMVVLTRVAAWYKAHLIFRAQQAKSIQENVAPFPRKKVIIAISILLVLIFSKYFYMASMTSYFTFYLIEKFHISVSSAQIHLFLFLFAVAAGTLIGGPLGDKIGRKYVIWISILGVAPFSLALPYAGLAVTSILSVFIGIILASAFSAILVYAQELMPGKVGLIAGLFFGLAFGMGGLGSALLGQLADRTSIGYVYQVCSYLPLLGLLAVFLPDTKKVKKTKV